MAVRHVREMSPNVLVQELREAVERADAYNAASGEGRRPWTDFIEEAANMIEHLSAELDSVKDLIEQRDVEHDLMAAKEIR